MKPLPYVEPLGRVKLNLVKAYDKRLILKASAKNKDDNPVLYIDLEHPRDDFTQMKETELHLGISANFRVEPQHDSSVKPHIDIYIPKSEIHSFLRSIIQANLIRRSGGRGTATTGFEGNLGASLLASNRPAPAPAPQAPAQSAGRVGSRERPSSAGSNPALDQRTYGEESSAKPAVPGEAEAGQEAPVEAGPGAAGASSSHGRSAGGGRALFQPFNSVDSKPPCPGPQPATKVR